MNQDDKPITKKDLESALAAFGSQLADAIITQLRNEMQTQGTQLRSEMHTQGEQLRGEMKSMASGLHEEMKTVENGLRGEMKSMEERIVEDVRDEFTSKLAATENRLKRHTEEVAGEHAAKVLDAIAGVVEPLQTKVKEHGRRLKRLEHKLA